MSRHAIEWSHGSATVETTAAMLDHCVFLVDGVPFSPLARAPWLDEGEAPADLPGHLRRLAGEFVCLPFGEGGPACEVAVGWEDLIGGVANVPSHGPAGDEEWERVEQRAGGITLRLRYPEGHLIDFLERRIDGVEGEPALALSLRIVARRDGATSLGLHPIVRLPEEPGALALSADFAFGLTYPALLAPGVARTRSGSTFDSLDAIPGVTGPVDLSRLPLDSPAEEVVLLCGARGPVTVQFREERMLLEVDWDRDILPSAQLWLSDRALQEAPWGGRYRGLGIEPIAAAFDLADEVSTAVNPITDRGVATAVELREGHPLVIDYRLTARRA